MIHPKTSFNNQFPLSEIFELHRKTALVWRESTAETRIALLIKLKEWIMSNKQLVQEAIYQDFKKPAAETDLTEIFPITSEINHAVKNLESWMKPQKVSAPLSMIGTSAKVIYEPKGASLIIGPWNYPFNLAIGPLVSALAAGCTAIIKPSELTPHTSLLISTMISEIYDVSEVAVFQGGVEMSQQLLALPFDHIFFTGSPAVGKIVMAAAAKNLSSVTLELGGKSPVIIDAEADLEDAAEKLIRGKYINAGQTCVAPDYIFVHTSIKERLISELTSAIQKMYDPKFKGIENSQDLARIINDKNFERLSGLLDDAIRKGAKIEFGGKKNHQERYMEPTILTGLTEQMKILEEEIFGPLLPILEYSELTEVIHYINENPKPLALYYFGTDSKNKKEILQQTSSGNTVINDCVIHFIHPNLPFGGVNHSGIGSAHGHYGFLAFSHQKGVLTQRVGYNNASLLKPPYNLGTRKIIQKLIKWF